jgi:uridine phosphorylase
MYAIEPKQIQDDAERAGIPRGRLRVPEAVVLTFSETVESQLIELGAMHEWNWPGWQFCPYSSPARSYLGSVNGIEAALIVPPMGASPVIALCEELAHFGSRLFLLLCASWSLGEDCLARGQIQVPSFAVGLDGTSPHYGNKGFEARADEATFEAFSCSLREMGASWKEGGVGSCEAIYRITSDMIEDHRSMGCLSMENGETAALFSFASQKGFNVGVLLQPYIDLTQGWTVSYMDETYRRTCLLQAEAAARTIEKLHERS